MFTWEKLFEEKERRHNYYIQNRAKYAERARRREIEKADELRDYKARYYQEVTKKRNHGLAATTPIREKPSARQPSKLNASQTLVSEDGVKVIVQPPRTLYWD